MSKGQYIGVNSPIIEKQTITVNENNINGYFDVNNGDTYYFKMSGGELKSVGGTSQTATTTLTALWDMPVSFDYKVSSESGYDIFTVTVAGTSIASISGEKSGSWSGTLKAGEQIKLEYAKDHSGSQGDDTATVSNLKVTSLPVSTGAKTTLTADNAATYFENGGTGNFWYKNNVQYLIQRRNYNGDGDMADALRLQARSDMIVSFVGYFSLSYTESAYVQAGKTMLATIAGGESVNKSFSCTLRKGDTLVIGWKNTSQSPLYGTSVDIHDIKVMPFAYKSSGKTGQVARKIAKEYLGVSGVARSVIVGKLGVSGVAREYMGGPGKLTWPPETYNTEAGNSIQNSFSLDNGKAVLACSGRFNSRGQSAGVVMHYKRGGQQVLLPAGTVINCQVSVSHSGYADGGLLVVYTDGTTDTSGYNATTNVSITMAKPGYVQVEATKHSETDGNIWDGTESGLYCTTTLTSMYIDGAQVWPQ